MDPRTRASKRKTEFQKNCIRSAIKKTRQAIESSGGGDIVFHNFVDSEDSSPEISETEEGEPETTDIPTVETGKMADLEGIRELARVLAQNMNEQQERDRERERERENEREGERQRERERDEAREAERAQERERERIRERERELANIEKYKEIIEGQARFHREDTELLAAEFEKLRIEKEQNRNRVTQRLPSYDGVNQEFEE